MTGGRIWTRLAVIAIFVLLVALLAAGGLYSLTTPANLERMATSIAKREGIMPGDAHVYFFTSEDWSGFPHELIVSGSWHTCQRENDMTTGGFAIDLVSQEVVEYSYHAGATATEKKSLVPWTELVELGPDGSAVFDCAISGVQTDDWGGLPRLSVLSSSGEMLLTVPWDTIVTDTQGRPLSCADLFASLDHNLGQQARVTAEDKGGAPWTLRIELVETRR